MIIYDNDHLLYWNDFRLILVLLSYFPRNSQLSCLLFVISFSWTSRLDLFLSFYLWPLSLLLFVSSILYVTADTISNNPIILLRYKALLVKSIPCKQVML